MFTIVSAKASLPVTSLVLLAKKEFVSRSSAVPRFCYLPFGLYNDFCDAATDEIRGMVAASPLGKLVCDIKVLSYAGMDIRCHDESAIVVTEAPL